MKKVLDFIIIAFVFVLLITVWKTSLVEGTDGRHFSSPQAVRRNAVLQPNVFGGHNYYVNNHKVGYSKKNLAGSYDIYIGNRLKYRGSTFQKEHKFTDVQPTQSVSQTRTNSVVESRSGYTARTSNHSNARTSSSTKASKQTMTINGAVVRKSGYVGHLEGRDERWAKRLEWTAKRKAENK